MSRIEILLDLSPVVYYLVCMNRSIADYFYNVLGIRHIPKMKESLQSYAVVFIAPATQSTAALDLIGKMAAAMKLSPQQWTLLDGVDSNWQESLSILEKSQCLLAFNSELFELLKNNFPQWQVYQIPSPDLMLEHPEMKRQAWQTLKTVMTQIQN